MLKAHRCTLQMPAWVPVAEIICTERLHTAGGFVKYAEPVLGPREARTRGLPRPAVLLRLARKRNLPI
jgi:hypothetical protein